MSVDRSAVHRNLDAQIKFFGMELFDVIGVGAFASTMNLIFGQTSVAGVMVFGLPVLLAGVIFWGKRGKPDRYLPDLIRFSIFPGVFCAGSEITKEKERIKEIVVKS